MVWIDQQNFMIYVIDLGIWTKDKLPNWRDWIHRLDENSRFPSWWFLLSAADVCGIACERATKLNKCRCKSRVIFTAAAGILIFTAEVGAYCPRWSARAAAAIEKDLSLYTNLSPTCLFLFVHTHFSPVTHLLRRTSVHTNLSLSRPASTHL